MHDKKAFKPEIVSEDVPENLPPNPNVQPEDSVPEADDVEFEVMEFSEDVERVSWNIM